MKVNEMVAAYSHAISQSLKNTAGITTKESVKWPASRRDDQEVGEHDEMLEAETTILEFPGLAAQVQEVATENRILCRQGHLGSGT